MISADPGGRIGITNDPAETEGWCAWLDLRKVAA
jgi:hypothetical protein